MRSLKETGKEGGVESTRQFSISCCYERRAKKGCKRKDTDCFFTEEEKRETGHEGNRSVTGVEKNGNNKKRSADRGNTS